VTTPPDFSSTDYQVFLEHDRNKAALERAWNTRNFEIELYWKRAAYFWTMLGALFAAYGFAEKRSDVDQDLTLILSCVGFVVSLAWYLVNRGSAAWQKNWEAHIDALEDAVTGPLYKVVRAPSPGEEWRPHGPLNISPSKVTITVSLFIAATWLLLLFMEAGPPVCIGDRSLDLFRTACTVVTWIAAAWLLLMCRTSKGVETFRFSIRKKVWS
jgi:hypothetical protein